MNSSTFHEQPTQTPERLAFYAELDRHDLGALWEVLGKLGSLEPRPASVPAHWNYDDLRPLLMKSGSLISAEEAERRVLVLENPGLRGRSQITGSLYAGLQLILPGEIATSHRHVASALRFIVEGRGAYTAVDGERVSMRPGDFIITPSWTFHDHGNIGEEPVVWMDGLDIPIVNLFDAGFAQKYAGSTQPVTRAEGDALARYGTNMLPVEYTRYGSTSPVFSYPYERSREALARLARSGPLHPSHGVKLQYVNPATGGAAMPTIGTWLQLLPAGFDTAAYRSTDGTVFSVVEGSGYSVIGGKKFVWKPKDIFVVPSWVNVEHHADDDAVLFSFSDRPSQQALGLWREEAISS